MATDIANGGTSTVKPMYSAEDCASVANLIQDRIIEAIETVGQRLPVDDHTKSKIVVVLPNMIRELFQLNRRTIITYLQGWEKSSMGFQSREQMILDSSAPRGSSIGIISTFIVPLIFEIIPQVCNTSWKNEIGLMGLVVIEELVNIAQRVTKGAILPNVMRMTKEYASITSRQMENRTFEEDGDDGGSATQPTSNTVKDMVDRIETNKDTSTPKKGGKKKMNPRAAFRKRPKPTPP